MKTICMINQKGGCGKSSSCFHLSGAIAKAGFKVLLVDADPQGSLSQGFFGSAFVEQLPLEATAAALFDSDLFLNDFSNLVRETPIPDISICPANQFMAQFNTPNPEKLGMEQYAVRDFLESQSEFDFTIIDCPPNLYRCSWSAMLASDFVVIPVPPEDFGTQGLRVVHQAIDNVRVLNPSIRRLGHLITRYDRRLLIHRSYEKRLRELYPELVLNTVIPEASAFKVALTCRQPVSFSEPKSAAAYATEVLCDELLSKMNSTKTSRRIA